MKKLLIFAAALFAAQFSYAQWEADVRLTDNYDTSYLSYGKCHNIVTSGDTVHIVWYAKTYGAWEILYKRSTDSGLSWEADARLTMTIEYSTYPSMSVSGSLVYIIWSETIDGNMEIYFIRSTDGGTNWETATRLSVDPQDSHGPVIASNGSFVYIAWVTSDADSQTKMINFRCSSDGGMNWSTVAWLSPDSTWAYNVSIAVSGSDVHVTWNDDRDGNLEIYYRKSSDSGLTWGPEIRLTDDPATSSLPSIAVSGSSVHITWNDFRDGNAEIYYKGSVDGGENWGDDIRITNDPGNSISSNLAESNSVLHVVWQDYRSGFSDIFYNYSTDGGETWATDTQLNDFSFSSQRPFIAVSDPVLHVIWYDYRDFNYEIYYKQNPTGGVFVGLENELLNNSGQQISIFPNPAGKQLTVGQSVAERSDVPTLSGSSVRLSIVDLFGREVKAIANVRSFPYQLDISDLPDGVYILKMTDEKENTGSVKFLKLSDK